MKKLFLTLLLLLAPMASGQSSRPPYYFYPLTDSVLYPTNLYHYAQALRLPFTSELLRIDSSGIVTNATVGANLTWDGTTLAALPGTTNSSITVSNVYATNVYTTNLFAEFNYVSNIYVTNLFSETSYISNSYVTNLYVTNIFNAKTTITSNLYVTNIYAFSGTLTNDLIVLGNTYGSNTYAANLTVSNSITGTIDATQSGLVLKQRRSLKLQYPRRIDGAGCTYSNTNDYTAQLFMVPRFSASAATNANYAEWAFRVPSDLDTSSDLTASLTIQLAGADTDAATYTVGVISIANSSAGAGTPANYVTLTIPADGSGASGDIESVNNVTLTGWRSALTANQWMLVRLQRDGTDASAVAQYGLELEITYVSSQ